MAVTPQEITPDGTVAAATPSHWQVDRETYHAMARAGVFGMEEHTELIDGIIYTRMTPVGTQHAFTVTTLRRILERELLPENDVTDVSGINLSGNSEPEPDIIVVKGPIRNYTETQPTPRDLLLVVEVSKSSLALDRKEKAKAYAKAMILEYWIINLVNRQVEVHRNPQSDGTYATIEVVSETGIISPLAKPDALIPVAGFLP